MYVPIHQELPGHPKLRRLQRALTISRPQAIGHLTLLWLWAQSYAPDGCLSYADWNSADIVDAAEWEGDPEVFMSALVSTGFVDDCDGALFLHDWQDGGGKIVREKAADRGRKRNKRTAATQTGIPAGSANTPNLSDGSPSEVRGNSAPNLREPIEGKQTHTQDEAAGWVGETFSTSFEQFWAAYPQSRQTDRDKCRAIWQEKGGDQIVDAILTGLAKWRASEQWTKEDSRYVPFPEKFLTRGDWEREPPKPTPIAPKWVDPNTALIPDDVPDERGYVKVII